MERRKLVSLVLGITAIASFANQAIARRIESTKVVPVVEKPKSDQSVLVLAQQTSAGSKYTVCVARNAIKFACEGLSIVSCHPDWHVKLVNERSKLFWDMPQKEFTGLKIVESFRVRKLEPSKTKKEPDVRIADQAVISQEGTPEITSAMKTLGVKPVKVTAWTTSSLQVDQPVLDILARIYGLEGIKGIPMRIVTATDKGEKIECLATQWGLEREVPKDFFDVPKPYRKGKNFDDVETQQTVTTLRSQLKKGRSGKTITENSQNVPFPSNLIPPSAKPLK